MQTTASGCHTHSRADLFLTVTKNACATFECQESLTATFAWVTEVENCSTDGEDDVILIQNNIMTPPGEHYAFLLTDSDENLIEVILDSFYNFEGAGTEELRVYGMSYDGDLSPAIGQHRSQTTASNCYIHSGDNLYLTIFQTAACATSVVDRALSESLIVYPNPAQNQLNIRNSEQINWQQLEVVDMLGREVLSLNPNTSSTDIPIDISRLESGNYSLRLLSQDGRLANKFFRVDK
ncbi:MAG: T9SS type A sorting domain-containing protein [Bacteroidota bacterium]